MSTRSTGAPTKPEDPFGRGLVGIGPRRQPLLQRIELRVHSLVLELTGKKEPAVRVVRTGDAVLARRGGDHGDRGEREEDDAEEEKTRLPVVFLTQPTDLGRQYEITMEPFEPDPADFAGKPLYVPGMGFGPDEHIASIIDLKDYDHAIRLNPNVAPAAD